jgi:Core-2/I-Branching enzyme
MASSSPRRPRQRRRTALQRLRLVTLAGLVLYALLQLFAKRGPALGGPEAPAARIAFAISLSGQREIDALARLLRLAYHPDNLYVVHLDAKAPAHFHKEVRQLMDKVKTAGDRAHKQHALFTFAAKSNMILLDNPMFVTWSGFTSVVAALYSLATAISWGEWEYWINVSALDMVSYALCV